MLNNKSVKGFNQAIILDSIRIHKAISKAELAQATGLSPTAIGMITSELIEKGYIHEIGTGESKGGRKPVLLELKPRSFYSIGFDTDVEYLNVILIDITGEIIYESIVNMPENTGFNYVVGKIEDAVQDILYRFPISLSSLLGIGISVPGMVNNKTDEIAFVPNLNWSNIDAKPLFTRFLNTPILIENEAKASAICENWVGACQGIDDFICINIKSGIGCGIFTDGKLYRGPSGSAGEVGHIVVCEDGPKCGCGNNGCLETVASTSRIVDKVKKLIREGTVADFDVNRIGIDEIICAARAGDETIKSVLMESARYIGIAISELVNILNPSKVVIGKEFLKYADLVLDYIKSIVASKALKLSATKLQIEASTIGERSSALGAAIIPLKVLFGKA